jgi:hypothetical protein
VLIKVAREANTRQSLILLGAILDTPGLAARLLEALKPEAARRSSNRVREGRCTR